MNQSDDATAVPQKQSLRIEQTKAFVEKVVVTEIRESSAHTKFCLPALGRQVLYPPRGRSVSGDWSEDRGVGMWLSN